MATFTVLSPAETLRTARSCTDELFTLISDDTLYERPVPDRHRLIFYLGHLEAFDWNQVCRGALGMSSFHPEFDRLFEFGIDPEPGSAPADAPSDWPSSDEVRAYNSEVRRRIDAAIANAPDQIINVALEHRLMHAETLAYLLHNLDQSLKRKIEQQLFRSASPPDPQFIAIPRGRASLGQVDGAFGWDNEFPAHTVDVPAFRVSKYKITNGEYLRFVNAGTAPPHFWVERNGEWHYRGMFVSIPLPLDWPVYVTYDEASAYAAWAGKSLLTEPQFHRAAYDGRASWRPDVHGNYAFTRWDPVPVTATPMGDSPSGVSQLVGNGWEWTSTPFAPFLGFKPFPFYPGYSQNFFDGRHYVLKGASPRTAVEFLRPSFRNWFRPNYPYVYATFRLVENG